MSMLRRSLVLGVVAALAVSAAPAQAQFMADRQKEIRIDMLMFQTADGNTNIMAAFPGALSLAIYLNDKIAIEPQLSFVQGSGGGVSAGAIAFGVFVPYYLAGDMGKTGLFVSPGLEMAKTTGDLATDMVLGYGVDVGIKRSMREGVSMRLAANVRMGDLYNDVTAIGLTAGIGVFWK